MASVKLAQQTPSRCTWCGQDPLYVQYHDTEWGSPLHNDRHLFEMLTLEGAQAGLSWLTILRKRSAYQSAFAHFDPKAIARFSENDLSRILTNSDVVRNRLKIYSVPINARGVLAIQKEFGSLDSYLWSFVNYQTIQPHRKVTKDVPTQTEESKTLSRDLLRRGFKFVGPTICYALMQSIGMVNDHLTSCYRWKPLTRSLRA
jgi:DNA-3-methyladenine glycosylase I